MQPAQKCRLCAGETSIRFRANLLDRDVGYFICQQCGGLQTDYPEWLSHAYKEGHLSTRDTGAVERCLRSQAIVFLISKVLRFPEDAKILDFGAGNGLLCRLLRDVGFDCYCEDPYGDLAFARPFAKNLETNHFFMVTAFEVIEHLLDPQATFKKIFCQNPTYVLLQTEPYKEQNSDWHYLGLRDGQHIFFYADKTMHFLAREYGYFCKQFGDFYLLSKEPITKFQIQLLNLAPKDRILRWIRGWLAFRSTFIYAQKDLEEIDRFMRS